MRNPDPDAGYRGRNPKDAPGPKPLKEKSAAGGTEPANQWLALLNLGWVFVATLVITVFGGIWLDRRFGTAPVFILIGVFLGFTATGYYFYQTLRKLEGPKPPKP
jgi:ATP synthase protein I